MDGWRGIRSGRKNARQDPEAHHVLLIEDEPELRRLLREELSEILPFAVEAISPEAAAGNPGQFIGALVVSLPGRAKHVVSLIPSGHPFLPLKPSAVDSHFNLVHELKEASVIGIASVSQEFLHFARALLTPVAANRHAIEEHLLDEETTRNLSGLDLVFCDSIARKRLQARRVMHYRLTSDAAAQEISDRIASAVD